MFCFFFFSSRRRHTRCSRDWSSDVCSSDLVGRPRTRRRRGVQLPAGVSGDRGCRDPGGASHGGERRGRRSASAGGELREIGRASCRERGVDLGGRRIIKKKKKKKRIGVRDV